MDPDRITALAVFLGTKLGLDPARIQVLRAAMPMHDVGEIGTVTLILRKRGVLTERERSEMQLHTVVGYEIFAGSENDVSRMSASIALTHHECFDGSGYPNGLVGEKIPLEGRIAAVADVFDALLSERSHRSALSRDDAIAVMRKGRNTRFDPEIVDLLLDHLDEAPTFRGVN